MSWQDDGFARDPVHYIPDVGWFFYDETWSEGIGPYETEGEAREGLRKYTLTFSEPSDGCCGHRSVGHYGI